MQDDTRWCKMMQDDARWCKMMQYDARWCKMMQDDARWCKMMQDDAQWCKMMQNDARWCKMIQDDAWLCKMMQDDDDNDDPMILNIRSKNHTSERTIVPWTVIFELCFVAFFWPLVSEFKARRPDWWWSWYYSDFSITLLILLSLHCDVS